MPIHTICMLFIFRNDIISEYLQFFFINKYYNLFCHNMGVHSVLMRLFSIYSIFLVVCELVMGHFNYTFRQE